ncbi:MAG TPA: bifunctional ADP-dependent NAD(P)H-hydrate dehydratase/NAD(P)H-hydrate epimerase, partial [Bacteroidales bacterium]|nr:bifunctional ADP-dependent NAD(P)H-hydrate dehydratase/NAD(P)H-hydrate epimerase [Bacteroidales bacterium]
RAIEASLKYEITVVLKGAHTQIVCPDGKVFVNSTGNAGMATAGSGDVLTGIVVSLLAQGYSPQNATIFAVYLHGLAGDIAAANFGFEALTASDIVDNISKAYKLIYSKNE